MCTAHERIESFGSVKKDRQLPRNFKGSQIVGKLILKMTDSEPMERPSAEDIKDNQIKVLKSMKILQQQQGPSPMKTIKNKSQSNVMPKLS